MLLLHRKTRQAIFATMLPLYIYMCVCGYWIGCQGILSIQKYRWLLLHVFLLSLNHNSIDLCQRSCANLRFEWGIYGSDIFDVKLEPTAISRTRQTLLGRPPHNRCCYQGGDHISRGPSQYSHYISPPILRVFSSPPILQPLLFCREEERPTWLSRGTCE